MNGPDGWIGRLGQAPPADVQPRQRRRNTRDELAAARIELANARELTDRIAAAGDNLSRIENAGGMLAEVQPHLDMLTAALPLLEGLAARLRSVHDLEGEMIRLEHGLRSAAGAVADSMRLVERVKATIPAVERIELLIESLDKIQAIRRVDE